MNAFECSKKYANCFLVFILYLFYHMSRFAVVFCYDERTIKNRLLRVGRRNTFLRVFSVSIQHLFTFKMIKEGKFNSSLKILFEYITL